MGVQGGGGGGGSVLNAGLKKIYIWKVSDACNEEPHAGPRLALPGKVYSPGCATDTVVICCNAVVFVAEKRTFLRLVLLYVFRSTSASRKLYFLCI